MKKPKYIEELLKIIFWWLGIVFVCAGILSYIGVLKPKSGSLIQEPAMNGHIFLVIGFVFVVVSFISGVITVKKNKLHSELLADGARIKGVVEKVYLQKYTRHGNQSPYRVQYVYTYQDKVYHHKSCFIWEKPNLMIGDTIMVYVNDFGKSTILL